MVLKYKKSKYLRYNKNQTIINNVFQGIKKTDGNVMYFKYIRTKIYCK